MKSFKLFFIATIVMASMPMISKAQYDELYTVDDNTFITTKPNAVLYKPTSGLFTPKSNLTKKRELIDVRFNDTKTLKKTQQLRVLRYLNTKKQQEFNAYVVLYKDVEWVLIRDYVQDNRLMDSRNEQMLNMQSSLNAKKEDSFRQYDSLFVAHKKECEDSVRYYREKKERLITERKDLLQKAEVENERRYDETYTKWYHGLPASTKNAIKNIAIIKNELTYPNSVGGCDYWLKYVNYSEKPIKYLYWTGVVYNAVDDPVSCEIRRRKVVEGKDTGPINHWGQGGGCWSHIIYNHSARTLKLTSIKIIYMDNSSLYISEADLKKIFVAPQKESLNVGQVTEKHDFEIKKCSEGLQTWIIRDMELNKVKVVPEKEFTPSSLDYYKRVIKVLYQKKLEYEQYKFESENFEKFLNFQKME